MPNLSKITRDHDVIRKWAEERGATPSHVRRTGSPDDVGVLRLDFPGYSGEGALEEISWDQFFEKFDDQNLALVYEEETAAGQKSNFNKLISAATAAQETGGRRSGRASTRSGGTRKAASTRTAAKKAPAKKKAAKKSPGKKTAAKKTAAKERRRLQRRFRQRRVRQRRPRLLALRAGQRAESARLKLRQPVDPHQEGPKGQRRQGQRRRHQRREEVLSADRFRVFERSDFAGLDLLIEDGRASSRR